MSDVEMPPSNQDKLDLKAEDSTMDGEDTAEEGQEEWLSEDILSEDDRPSNAEVSLKTELPDTLEEASQDDTMPSGNTSNEHPEESGLKEAETEGMDIEETLNNFEGPKDEPADDADKPESKNVKTEANDEDKQSQDDGNDTDELLRMLSEDNNKSKRKLTKTVKDLRNSAKSGHHSTDDEEFDFKGATVKKMKISKTVSKKQNLDDIGDGDDDATDGSSDDESKLVKNMFSVKKPSIISKKIKSATPSSKSDSITTKHVVNVVNKSTHRKDQVSSSTPLKQYVNKHHQSKTLMKPLSKPLSIKSEVKANKQIDSRKEPAKLQTKFTPPEIRTPAPFKSSNSFKSIESKHRDNEIDENDEYLDEDIFNMEDDEYESDFEDELTKTRHRLLKSGRDDLQSDADSRSDDGSLYDEIPSSDSDNLDDWFQLDIRAEKAGDYLPLLGPKAKELLLEEKKRLTNRLTDLRQSLTALTESGKQQAEQLRTATMTLAQIDDLLKAS